MGMDEPVVGAVFGNVSTTEFRSAAAGVPAGNTPYAPPLASLGGR
ncbi:MAG: hypothetical protein QOE90_1930 [Thermoplasmata archaeon]|jgi:hypothetical protein|nr:hypothetical protein [Thermoplasmata archaeon]